MSLNQLLKTFVILISFVITHIYFFYNLTSLALHVSFCLNIIIFLLTFIKVSLQPNFTIRSMISFYFLIFFGFFSYYQWITSFVHFDLMNDIYVMKANFVIGSFFLLYNFFYLISSKKRTLNGFNDLKLPSYGNFGFLVIFFIACYIILFGLVANGIHHFTDTSSLVGDWGPNRLVFQFFILPIPLLYVCLWVMVRKNTLDGVLISMLLFFAGCLLLPIFGSARFLIFTIYTTFFLSWQSFRVKRITPRLFNFFILPLMFFGAFIHSNVTKFINGDFNVSINQYLHSGHFDSFEVVTLLIEFADKSGYASSQILGPLLFFMPSSIFQSKPIGSGAYLAEHYPNIISSNISAPIVGEVYLYGGFLYVYLFALALAFIHRKIDAFAMIKKRVENNKQFLLGDAYKIVIFLLIFNSTLIFLRGDLLNSISSIVGILVSAYICKTLFRIKTN